jgi:hypothetical protein
MGRSAEPPAAIPGAPPRPSASSAAVAIADVAGAGPPAVPAAELHHGARVPGRLKVKPNSLLAARAAEEYVYVGKDLRRIAIVGVSVFVALFVAWILLVVANLSGMY